MATSSPFVRWAQHLVREVGVGVGIYCVLSQIATGTQLVGMSMSPTFAGAGDFAVCERISKRLDLLQRGDVVSCISPEDPKMLLCKRVIAFAGDTVTLHGGNSWWPMHTIVKIPAGHVFLMGDNVSCSKDSRAYGPVPRALIQGRLFVHVWPPHRVKWVDREIPSSITSISTVTRCPDHLDSNSGSRSIISSRTQSTSSSTRHSSHPHVHESRSDFSKLSCSEWDARSTVRPSVSRASSDFHQGFSLESLFGWMGQSDTGGQ